MKTYLLNILLLSVLILLTLDHLLAQGSQQTRPFQCGTPTLSPTQMQALQRQMEAAVFQKGLLNKAFSGITYVPIRPHILRRSNGSGGYSLADMNLFMAQTNSYFLLNGTGIQFYFCGTSPEYLDNDEWYDNNFDGLPITLGTDATNALNQYYVQRISNASGYGFLPDTDYLLSTRSVINVASGGDIGNYIIPHELGHNLNLQHTFHNTSNGLPWPTDELVTRGPVNNCSIAGDLVCDTPADPYNMPGVDILNVNGCYQYDPNSTARDANGEPFTPSLSNIMSYWAFGCLKLNFTPGQLDRMQGGLALRQTHTSYTLDCPPTNVTPASNLVVYTSPTAVVIEWQDNATNEMGYFIERSTDPTTGFVPVGGVAPDVRRFVDTKVEANTQYYYRIRPSNTTTGHLSPTISAFTETCRPQFQNGCATGDGLNGVSLDGQMLSQNSGCSVGGYGQFTANVTNIVAGQLLSFSLTFLNNERPQGVTIWADLNHNQAFDLEDNLFISPGPKTGGISGTLLIPEGTDPGLLTLRVITAYNTMPFYPCDPYQSGETEDYQLNITAAPVTGLTVSFESGNAQLHWNSLGLGVSYDLQWRPVGSTTWNTVTNYTDITYTLFGLTINTAYEWQVRRSGALAYSSPVSFTTPCPVPLFLTTSPTRTIAYLSWSYHPGQTYTLHWRSVGNPNWNTVSSLTAGYYSLTGLTANTAYEWAVQGICSPSVSTSLAGPVSFTTTGCAAPSFAYATDIGNTSARIYWVTNYVDPERTFQIYYRPMGTADWQTIGGISTQTYTLTGLTGNTPYEFQVQSICSPTETSTLTPSNSFTTRCASTQGHFSSPKATEATLSWSTPYIEAGTTFALQYRVAGNPNWTNINSLTSSTYMLTGLTTNVTYEWRVRTVCPGNGLTDYSAIQSFTTVCSPVQFTSLNYVSATSALVSWFKPTVDAGTRFEIRYRPVGSPDWAVVSNLLANYYYNEGRYLITGLTNNTTYEWQIRTVCTPTEGTNFVAGTSFTTQCRTPTTWPDNPQVTVAYLSWSSVFTDAQYELRYRQTGTADWTTMSSLTAVNLTLTGLRGNTSYEWQVRTACGNGIYSDYSPVKSFTTLSCSPPESMTTLAITANTAVLYWHYSYTPAVFSVRWRAVGETDWHLIDNLSKNNVDKAPGLPSSNDLYSYTVALTSLAPATQYEWQIRTVCGAVDVSPFSSSIIFQTLPPCLSMYTLKSGSWADPAVWSCNRIPTATDPVEIRHTVTLPGNFTGHALQVRYDVGQKLIYNSDSRLQLGF